MTVLETFAGFAARVRHSDLTDVEKARLSLHLLDTMGAAIAGRQTPVGRSLRDLQSDGDGKAAVWRPGTIDDLALRTGTIRHTEIDDIHTESNVTPSSVIVPVTLTLGARLGITDPARIGGALIAGYEALLRLGMAIDGPVVMYQGIWPTFFCAPFGAATAAARLMDLGPDATAHALANALTLCTGGAGTPGPNRPGRWFVIGEAARLGAMSALAAARGFTADLSLLDGKWLGEAHGLRGRPDAMTEGLGSSYIVNDISMKPCCTGKQVAAALAGFQKLLADGLDPEAATKIEVHVPKRYASMIDRRVMPGTNRSTTGNTRYQFGLAAFHPQGLFDAARPERVHDARIDALMDKVSIVVDESLECHMPRYWPARVEVTTSQGKLTETVVAAPGDPECRFSAEAVRGKFHALVDPIIGVNEAEDWIEASAGALAGAGGSTRLIAKFETLFRAA